MRHLPVDCCYCAECGVCGTHKSVSARCAAGLSGCAPCFVPNHGHSASIPHAFAPAALRASLASRGKPAGYPRRAMLGAPRCCRTGCAGSALASAPPDGQGVTAAPWLAATGCTNACRPQRWRLLPITSRRTVHGQPARSLWSFHATPQGQRRKVRQGRSRLSSGV